MFDHVRFNHAVESAVPRDGGGWDVSYEDGDGSGHSEGFDVLMVGAGNSGCDVAVESARIAAKVCLSMRNPQWFVPKFMFGMPSDVFAARARWLPRRITQWTFAKLLRLVQGHYGTGQSLERFGGGGGIPSRSEV